MHQDINSGLDWVKIHKTVSFLVNNGSCILGVLAQNFINFIFNFRFQLLCYTALTDAIQTSDVSCSCLCRI